MERAYVASEDRFLEVHRKLGKERIADMNFSAHSGRRSSKSSTLISYAKALGFGIRSID